MKLWQKRITSISLLPLGSKSLPPLFGLIANHIGAWVMPVYLLTILVLMVWMHERMLKKVTH